MTSRFGTIAALLAIALPIALFAQNRFSTLSGSVMDPSGGLLPGVTVAAIDMTRGARHEVKTNRTGQFEIIGLAEGPHVLEVTLPGFQKFEQKLTLDGQDVNRNITMRVGTLTGDDFGHAGRNPSVGTRASAFHRNLRNAVRQQAAGVAPRQCRSALGARFASPPKSVTCLRFTPMARRPAL